MVSTFNLLPAQAEFMRVAPGVTLDVCLYQGGFGSGKTFSGSLLGLLLCQKYPGISGLVVAKTFPLLRDTTLATYLDHLDAMEFSPKKDYTFNKSESRLTLHCFGDSMILFRHLESPEKVKSINAGFVEVEEMSQITEADFNMLLSRARQVGIPCKRVFGHTNPQPTKGWIHQYFVENAGQRPIEGGGLIHYRRILAPTTQNTFLTPDYVENMRHMFDDEYFRINVLGEDGDYTSGLVCNTWNAANVQETPYRPDQPLYISCDFNVDPMCWVFAHRYNGEYHFIDELCSDTAMTTVQAAEDVYRRFGAHPSGIILTGDASGANRSTLAQDALSTNYTIIRNTLSSLGVRSIAMDLRKANPPIDSRVAAWNALVCNSQGHRRVRVDPKCKWLIYNCENLKYIPGSGVIWEPTPKQIEHDNKLKYTKHVWDAASYLVERYDPIELDPAARRGGYKMRDKPYKPRVNF